MRIGELARRTGVSVRALRYYEEQGLLHPSRGNNGYRSYAEADIGRVAHIQLFYSAGLCSGKIEELLPCTSGDSSALIPGPALAAELEIAHRRISGQIEDLAESLSILERVIAASRQAPAGQVPLQSGPPAKG